jgi:ABC-2 type transport system ATP-binding protein
MVPTIVARQLTKVFRTYNKKEGLLGAVRGLVKREYQRTYAASQVSFSISEGELVGFLGPNGAGKTTVLKMLSGLLVPTSGSASVLGFTPWERRTEFKRQFSLVLGQKNSLWWDLPASESLELNRVIYQISLETFRRIVDELVDLLSVRDKLNVMVRELSLGERMKLELIAALIHQPRVLFLDEPTIGLDVISQKIVRDFLLHYNEQRRVSTILTSHYMQDIEKLCRRVIIIDHGKVFFDGEFSEITDRFARHKFLRFSFNAPIAPTPKLGEIIEQTPTALTLKVDRNKVADVCRELLSTGSVQDFSAEDEPLEDIIRQIFESNQVAESPLAIQPQVGL